MGKGIKDRKIGRVKSPPSRDEFIISWAVMAILAVIATGVFVKQFYYDPTVLTPSGLEFQGSKEADLVDFVPVDMDSAVANEFRIALR